MAIIIFITIIVIVVNNNIIIHIISLYANVSSHKALIWRSLPADVGRHTPEELGQTLRHNITHTG